MQNRTTNVFEKLAPSAINVVIVLILSVPALIIWGFGLEWKLTITVIFFFYNLAVALFNDNRCLGMIIMKTHWQKDFNPVQKLVYISLYTLSFSTIFFWIIFPFDLLLVNLLLVQLPLVLTKETTLHGYLSGNHKTIKIV